MKFEKIRYWLAVIIFSVAVFFFVDQFDLFNKRGIENGLLSLSKEINKKTPYPLDQFTILDTTIAHKNKLVYKMTIVNLDIEDKELDFDKKRLFINIRNQLCTKEDTKKVISQGAIFEYMYSEENGKYLFSITIDNNECLGMLKNDLK